MKQTRFIFVNDGDPESSDYDNNVVAYDAGESGSYERAMVEVKRLGKATTDESCRAEFRASMVTPREVRRTVVNVKRNDAREWAGWLANALSALISLLRVLGGRIGRGAASRRKLLPTGRFLKDARLSFP